MSENGQKLPAKERSMLTGFLKFLFFVIAFFGVMLTVLFNMGGSSETLHQSLEKLISDSLSGRPTRVMKLNRVSFFPSVGADFEKLEIKETMASEELTVSADKIRLFVTFWGFISRRMGIKALYFENVDIRKGILGRKAFKIEKLFIDHDKGTQKAVLRANGMLDEDPWTLATDLEVSGSVGGYTYHVGKDRNIDLKVGDLHLAANISEQISDYIKINNLSLGMPDERLKGELSVSLLEGQMVKLGGRLTSGETASILSPDLLIAYGGKTMKIDGKIESLKLDQRHINGPQGPIALLNSLHEMLAFDLLVPPKEERVPEDKPNETNPKEDKSKQDAQKKPEKKQEIAKSDTKPEKPREKETAYACRYDFNLKFVIKEQIDKDGKEGEGMEFDAVNTNGELNVTPVKGEVEPYRGPCRELDLLQVQGNKK